MNDISTRRIVTKVYVSRWGLTNEIYPRWVSTKAKGPHREHMKDFLVTEERHVTFKVMIDSDSDREELLKYVSTTCVPLKVREQ